ncbi:MAG: hypothetical protein ACPLPR_00235 [Bacillota bacterium]
MDTTVKKCEALLKRIKGVVAARVVPSGDNTFEAYVLAGHSRPVSQVERDVRTVLQDLLRGATVSRVAVAQLDEPLEACVLTPRIRLEEVTASFHRNHAEVEVSLSLHGKTARSNCQGSTEELAVAATAARAALTAVESLLGIKGFSLIEMRKVTLYDLAALVALVQIRVPSDIAKVVSGTCVLNNSPEPEIAVAGVRAALNAINRTVEGIIR